MSDKYDVLFDMLYEFYNIKDTYAYNLTRVKYAQLSTDDFEEFNENNIYELIECIKEWENKIGDKNESN